MAQLRGPQFVRLFRDVYLPAGMPNTHEVRCEGAALILPPTAVITGRSAATLRGVPLAVASDPVEVVIPLADRVGRRGGLDVRRSDLAHEEFTAWRGVRLATPTRTAIDLALDRPLADAVAHLDAVLRAELVAKAEVQRAVAAHHDNGIVAARAAVELSDARAESARESKMRVWLALAGLAPQPQYWVCDEHGPFARVDLGFEQQRLAVEYDGRWHGEWQQVDRDRERLNRLHAAGWRVVFVTAALLRDPGRMVQTVRAALAARS